MWGGIAGLALVLGAFVGYLAPVPRKVVAGVMAFGGGVLISALAFELMASAYEQGGVAPTAVGFLAGATLFVVADAIVNRTGGRHRKRSGEHQRRELGARASQGKGGGGMAIAIGSLMDGIPESLAIGASLTAGGGVAWVTVAAVFLSNVPEGMSSSAGMRRAGRSKGFVFGLWSAIAVASAAAAMVGQVVLATAPAWIVAAVVALAAGAILAMLANTMMPEAFEVAHTWTGLVTVAGFLLAFLLSKLGPQ